MTLHALVSAGGAPGVTTAALAMTLTWPHPVILAECDPAGGAVLAGLFSGHAAAGTGLLTLVGESGGSPQTAAAALQQHLRPIDDDGSRLLLAGLTDPRQAAALTSAWPALVAALSNWSGDVIADCGRVDCPSAILAAADTITMIMRPLLRHAALAKPRLAMLSELRPGRPPAGVLLSGAGGYPPREITRALGVPVLGSLPHDPRTAALLSDGHGSRRQLNARPLTRAAAAAGRTLRGAPSRTELPNPEGATL
jgi:hypothetical protein